MAKHILIIGGTRNLGHFLALKLLEAGHQVTLLNRGQTPDELPGDLPRLRADRSDKTQLAHALAGRSFDGVVDTTLYNGRDAQAIVELLAGRTGQYIFISTGQVYLVRPEVKRPFREEDYEGPVMAEPPPDSGDHHDWLYGVEKRQVEDVLSLAWRSRQFPFVSLRLPMVNSERDHFQRIYNYLLRLQDGGPILLPPPPRLALRHVYGEDVVKAIVTVIDKGLTQGRAYNISQDETIELEDFLRLLADIAGRPLQTVTVAREELEARHLLPGCSAFSDPWMSALDNRRSKQELGLVYTPLAVYLQKIVHYYQTQALPPAGYQRRQEELELASGSAVL
jgi:nucleoside-diphosphate-sugar epimerase